MAIYRLLQNSAFAPDEIRVMSSAYEDALRALRLADRSDPITQIVAEKIIELKCHGINDPETLLELTLKEFSPPQTP